MSLNRYYILSDSDILGSFDFFTYNIFLLADNLNFFWKIRSNPDIVSFQESVETYSVLIHEYRHYFDMSHTVYGFNYLFDLSEVLSLGIKEEPGNEFLYYKIKSFSNNYKKIRYPNYYNILLKQDNSKRWELRPTIGKIFDTKGKVSDIPILFARYYDEYGQLLSRHPFSMVSLLECSATLDEYQNSLALISYELREKPNERKMLEALFSKKTLDYLYDINLTEYSTCFHMVANHFNIKELQNLFLVTRILLDICLNFTDTHFDLINQHHLVDKLYKPASTFSIDESRHYNDFFVSLKNGLLIKERPILFYVLLQLMDKKSHSNQNSIVSELDSILSTSGLSLIQIFQDAKSLILDKAATLKNTKINYYSLIAKSVISNLSNIEIKIEDLFLPMMKHFGEFELPGFQIGDSYHPIHQTRYGIFKNLDYVNNFKEIETLKAWADGFDDACFF